MVINAHHESWLKDHYDGSQHFNQLFWSLWHDIALHFKSRDGHLIFEILNKPAQAGDVVQTHWKVGNCKQFVTT